MQLISGKKIIHENCKLWFQPKQQNQLTLTLKITAAQGVETLVTVHNSSIQDYVHVNDQAQPTYEMTLGLKPFIESERFWPDGTS